MTSGLELWGGPECTIVRVGDGYSDQFELSGHHRRIEDDVALFAGLGLRAIRYPILWERVSPRSPDERDWQSADAAMTALRRAGLPVIVGLVHHGSGPRYTDLLDDGFAPGLARHAAAVARRYPWIEAWTPVNEPVTTARFSCLYGHWYPHRRDEAAFWRALVNQVDGVRLAMRAVREINPGARLIQTDDLGRTYATASLRGQARFDNLRRWAGWDLLCGRLTPHHPFWARIAGHGLEKRLRAIAEAPCPPDVIGINHYLTSDRFLDHRAQRYPAGIVGGNDRQLYADVEAVRVLDPAPAGLEGALREAWRRYGIPVAATEIHLGCTREGQLRWLGEAWDTAERLRGEGIDVRAITAWALLGSHGWNTLLTRPGLYEPGAFDVSARPPRATAVATLARALASGSPRPPLARGSGWWRRPIRFAHPPVERPAPLTDHLRGRDEPAAPLLLILGGPGALGQALADACIARNIPHLAGTDPADAAVLDRTRPWAVADVARLDGAGPDALSASCADRGIATLRFRTDAAGEDGPVHHLLVRTSALFSPFGGDFAAAVVEALRAGRRFVAASDVTASPTYAPHLADAALDLLIDGEAGAWHLAGAETLSWAAFATRIAAACGLDGGLVTAMPARDLGLVTPCPVPALLHGPPLPTLDTALEQFAAAIARNAAPRDCAA